MTAYARIIVTGKNNAMPRTFRLPLAVGVDGSIHSVPVTLLDDEIICPDCKGDGCIRYSPINPSERDTIEQCERCLGNGLVTVEAA